MFYNVVEYILKELDKIEIYYTCMIVSSKTLNFTIIFKEHKYLNNYKLQLSLTTPPVISSLYVFNTQYDSYAVIYIG